VPWIGAALIPVNIRWSVVEIAYSLVESDTKVLLVDDAFAPMIPALRERDPGLTTVIHCGEGELPTGAMDYEELIRTSEPVEGGDAVA
jgi:acyl-CoA synthetase (AMP-forming)/AMP-acid ligase II